MARREKADLLGPLTPLGTLQRGEDDAEKELDEKLIGASVDESVGGSARDLEGYETMGETNEVKRTNKLQEGMKRDLQFILEIDGVVEEGSKELGASGQAANRLEGRQGLEDLLVRGGLVAEDGLELLNGRRET